MTQRLYYTDAYLTRFDATVVAQSADGTRVYLAETAFYPTSGGQLHDIGTLGGAAVVDVIDEDDRIAHILRDPPAAGLPAPAPAVIDWPRRFDHMQQHTGQHLVSAVFEDLFGHKTVSVHFGEEYSTLDLAADAVSRDQLLRAETRANEVVIENRPVTVTFEDAAAAIGLRKPADRAGTLRLVSIDGVDRSACGGTHVRATGEIGPILLRSTEKMKKTTRVEFVCGHRALRRARRDFESLVAVATGLSVSLDDAAASVAAQSERLKDAETARRRAEKTLADYRARELYGMTTPNADGVRTVTIRAGYDTMDELRTIALAVISQPKVVVVAPLANPPSILYAASEDSGVDAGKVLKPLLAEAGGRGGGSPRIAQGSVADIAALKNLERLLDASA